MMQPAAQTAHEQDHSVIVQAAVLTAVFAYVFGTDLIVKDYLPGGLGPALETAFRWGPAFALIALALANGALLGAPTLPLLLVFLAAVFQSVLRSPDEVRSTIEFLREMPVYLTAFLIAAGRLPEHRFWQAVFAATFAIALLSLLAAIAAPALAYTGYEWGASVRRLEGVAPQTVSLGFTSGIAVVLGLGIVIEALRQGQGRAAAVGTGLVLLAALCLLETQSRGPLIGTLIACVALLALTAVVGRMRDVVFLGLGIVLPLVFLAAYLLLLATPLDQMLALASQGSDRMMTLAERALIWDAARKDIAEAPLWGSGYRLDFYVEHHLTDEDGIYPSYHSAFLGIWRDAGILAFASLLLIIVASYFRALGQALTQPEDRFAALRFAVLVFVLTCGALDSSLSGGVLLMAAFGAYAFSLSGRSQ